MQKIDLSKFSSVLGNISVRGRGYFEAVMKIVEGRSLVEAGELELKQLEGKGGKSASGDGGVEVTEAVTKLVTPGRYDAVTAKGHLVDGPLSSGELAQRMGCNSDTVRRMLMDDEDVRRIGSGSGSKWELISKNQPKATKKTIAAKMTRKMPPSTEGFGIEAPRCKVVLEAIQKDPWFNTSRIAKEVLGNHSTAIAILDLLKKAKMIWTVEKTHNPSHKGQAHDRSQVYWEADPKAKIEVINMHVPRMPVRDLESLFPAIEEAVKAAKGWASKSFLKAHIGISDGPLDRILEEMKKQKLVKTVWKMHNPKHVLPKNFKKEHEYWELADAK